MKLGQVLRPKKPRNLQVTMALVAASLIGYLVSSQLGAWSPKRGAGLAFGFLAAALITFEMLYPARRPSARPLLSAQGWLQAHVYLGVLTLSAVLIHSGLRWPDGAMGWGLLLLSGWTTLSGLIGVALQKWIPIALAEGLRVEAVFERIPSLVEMLASEADVLMTGASDVLERFYRTEARPQLAQINPSWGFLMDVHARDRALEPLQRMRQFVQPDERERVEDLITICTEKMELDAHYSLQKILKHWLRFHVPAAGLLLGLTVVHLFAWLWY